MSLTLQEVNAWILSAAHGDLVQVSRVVKLRNEQLGQINAVSFSNGDRVYFDGGRGRGVIRGVFQGVARKNALVKADGGLTWRVAPYLLMAE
ncbi:hypothetical protein UFOVP1290_241 [uncultured Caudovirales phage]|uniref:Uncharacterized protein n=1 Tax=uncultured Caudovirales phage TaxID=2100421 RepID=A0A6J5RT04_9CAUD|nr:hypothetical protein UFOVP1290_241 [uncultured Caudovirales phage]